MKYRTPLLVAASLILVSLTIVVSVRAQTQFNLWVDRANVVQAVLQVQATVSTDKSVYSLGERVTIYSYLPPPPCRIGCGSNWALLISKPDGSQLNIDLGDNLATSGQVVLTIVADKAGRYQIGLQATSYVPGQPWVLVASCYFEVVGEQVVTVTETATVWVTSTRTETQLSESTNTLTTTTTVLRTVEDTRLGTVTANPVTVTQTLTGMTTSTVYSPTATVTVTSAAQMSSNPLPWLALCASGMLGAATQLPNNSRFRRFCRRAGPLPRLPRIFQLTLRDVRRILFVISMLSLILSLVTIAPVHAQSQFAVWTDKPIYQIGETVVVHYSLGQIRLFVPVSLWLYLDGPYYLDRDLGSFGGGDGQFIFGPAQQRDVGRWHVRIGCGPRAFCGPDTPSGETYFEVLGEQVVTITQTVTALVTSTRTETQLVESTNTVTTTTTVLRTVEDTRLGTVTANPVTVTQTLTGMTTSTVYSPTVTVTVNASAQMASNVLWLTLSTFAMMGAVIYSPINSGLRRYCRTTGTLRGLPESFDEEWDIDRASFPSGCLE